MLITPVRCLRSVVFRCSLCLEVPKKGREGNIFKMCDQVRKCYMPIQHVQHIHDSQVTKRVQDCYLRCTCMKCILSDQGTYRNSISALSIHSGPANAEFYVIGQLLQYRYCAFSAFFLSFFLCKLLVILGFAVNKLVLVFSCTTKEN